MFIRRENFTDFIRLYPIVTAIICINTIIFIFAHLPFAQVSNLFEHLIGVNLYIKEGQLWRLITPIFLHSALTHFIFNTFAILIFGPAIEQFLKSFKFFLFYLICGIGANIITYFLKPLTYSHLGASGAIFGFLGFYLYLIFYEKHLVSKQDSQMIKTLTFIAFLMSFIQSNVNISAHLSGYIIGFILAKFLSKNLFNHY